MKKYSDWFKVDLHIHTDYSKKTKNNDYKGVFNINTLKDKLIENDVKLFSLTDHNIINKEAYINYYNNFNEGDPRLLIGCEFDIEVPESNSSKTYHSVIIFDNSTIEDVTVLDNKIECLFEKKGLETKQRKIVIDDLYDVFNNFNFFFIPHAGNTKSIIEPYKNHDLELCQQMVLLMPSAFEKVKESARKKYNEGFDRLKSYDFKGKDDIPYINFSDNHNCYKYPCTNKNGENHKFYCIKGQPSFESIRYAFIDPKSRIKTFEEVESLKQFDNFLHSIKIENNSLINDTILNFSPNLNVIIGGRSSGKSLLFNILGYKIGNSKNDLNKYSIDSNDIKVRSFLDDEFKPAIKYNSEDVIYIRQGDIVNYFENNSLQDLIKESGKIEEYKEAIKEFRARKNDLINLIEKMIDSYSKLTDTLNSNFIFHEKDIKSILDSSYFFQPIQPVQDKTTSFHESAEIIQTLLEYINKFKNNQNWFLNDQELRLVVDFTSLVESKNKFFNENRDRHNLKEFMIESINNVINNKNRKLDAKGREKESASKRLTSLKNNFSEVFKTLIKIEKVCSTLENYRYNFIQEIKIDENVTAILEVEYKENLKTKIFEGLNLENNSISLYQALVELANEKGSIKYLNDNSASNLKKKVDTQLKSIFEYFDKPIEYLKYSEDSNSKNNSPGYNSEKYLETILRKGNSKIIFIDQPEDNLGNKFITENLIDLFRDLKFKKQIFLVTHNPSVVVYGDAESIILSSNENNTIDYSQLVLEDTNHQKEICTVLDGGQYIFEQRARKYNIKKIN